MTRNLITKTGMFDQIVKLAKTAELKADAIDERNAKRESSYDTEAADWRELANALRTVATNIDISGD